MTGVMGTGKRKGEQAMKKFAFWMMAAFLVLSAAWAQGAVQSISAVNTTQVIEIEGTGGADLPDVFRLFPVEPKAAIEQEIRRLYEFVNASQEQQPPILFFMQEQQQMIREKLPEGVLPDMLQVNEIVTIDEINYDTQIGDVRVEFSFATIYETGKTVSILLGVTTADVSQEWDENTDWNTNTQWHVLEAEVLPNGHLIIAFPQDVLQKMMTATATTMVVFSEP